MNTIIKNTIAAVTLVGFASLGIAATTKVTVNGMVCAFCAQGIEKRLSKLPETKAVFVDLKQKIVAVEAKPGTKLSDATIRSEITDAGYDVVKLEETSQSVAEIRQAMGGEGGK